MIRKQSQSNTCVLNKLPSGGFFCAQISLGECNLSASGTDAIIPDLPKYAEPKGPYRHVCGQTAHS